MPHRAQADPGALIDQSLLTAVTVIDDIMRLTPVEQLHADGAEQVLGQPPEGDDVFGEWNRKSVRWQLGF
jgi:hypothetical protein